MILCLLSFSIFAANVLNILNKTGKMETNSHLNIISAILDFSFQFNRRDKRNLIKMPSLLKIVLWTIILCCNWFCKYCQQYLELGTGNWKVISKADIMQHWSSRQNTAQTSNTIKRQSKEEMGHEKGNFECSCCCLILIFLIHCSILTPVIELLGNFSTPCYVWKD